MSISMKEYYLIGGAPLSGKSTIVKKLPDYWVISTDDIRSFLHNILKPEDNPDLFYGFGLDAVEFYDKYKDAKTVFDLELKQAQATQIGIDALIKSDFSWNKIAIEGIAVIPEYVSKIMKDSTIKVNYVFLHDPDANRIEKRIFERGLYDDADNYPDSIKKIEVEWVVMYNEYYKSECEKYNLKIHSIDELDDWQI